MAEPAPTPDPTTIPVLTRIATDLATAIAGIDVEAASPPGGVDYQVTVGRVVRPTKWGLLLDDAGLPEDYTPTNEDVILQLGDETPESDGDLVGDVPLVQLRQAFSITWIVTPTNAAKSPVDDALTLRKAELVRAVMADPTRAGLASQTTVQGSRMLRGAAEGVALDIDVTYWCRQNNPFLGLGESYPTP